MSNDVMIYASDLSKNFGSFRAVDKINFEVQKGEIVGFLGPNGAGKSTTMRILTCFIAPTSGTAKIKGHDVFDETLDVRRSLGYLPQRAPLYLEMSVYEYLKFASDLRNIDAGTFRKRAWLRSSARRSATSLTATGSASAWLKRSSTTRRS
jgi:ABC-2 type transport system ATP-binding protein